MKFYFDIDENALILLRYWAFNASSLTLIAIFLIVLRQIYSKKNVSREYAKILNIWKVISFSAILSSFIYFIHAIQLQIEYITNPSDINLFDGLFLFGYSLGAITFVFTCYLTFMHPEGLLVFDYQIVKATKAYGLVKYEPPENDYFLPQSLSQIQDYLSNLKISLDEIGKKE